MTVTDASGTKVNLASAPTKISSKSLFSDEVLLDLIKPEQFSSVTNLVDDEHFSAVAGKMPITIPRLDLNVERILVNQPDLVFAASWSDAGRVEQLRSAGIKVFLLPTPSTYEEIKALIKLVGKMVSEQNKAEAMVMEMDRRLEEELIFTSHRYKVLDYNSWGTSSTRQSTWQLIVDKAGFKNVVSDLQADKFGQTPMSKEMMVALNPEVLFVPGWIYGDEQGADNFMNQVMTDPALRSIDAIKRGYVYPIPENLRGTYSQHIVETILFVNKAVLGAPAP
ncbi:ABC transporter substrate-binding protein [Vibrio inusitatus NBRC 102082]|uniref:ABC transporter substrate-binding protein n=2 Tax=Vibrio inusitatus TaxID=413402 RepID=A0A4Y3HT79_9VIBR|nr:ABC transporter substrate-binding protein [Vibrio inusitatus NBRC 102082]